MASKPTEAILKVKKIYQITNPKLVQAPPTITLQAAVGLMHENKSGYIVIAEDRKVVGIFTEKDLLRNVLEKEADWSKPVSDYMTHNPMVLTPDDSVGKAISLMGKHRFYHIPLVDQDNLLTGVLSVRSLIRFLAEFYPAEIFNLPPNPSQVMDTPEGG